MAMSSIFRKNPLSATMLQELESSLSPQRFDTYLKATGGNREKAMRLYVWNTSIGAAFYGPLQALEVALRNAIDIQLAEKYSANWYDHPVMNFDARNYDQLDKAKSHFDGDGITPSNVVATLSFSFWTRLLSEHYEMNLWHPALHNAFPHAPAIDRKQAYDLLKKLPRFRNRIAHHEPIFHHPLHQNYQKILTAIGWISPSKKEWVKAHSRVEEILALPHDDPAVRF